MCLYLHKVLICDVLSHKSKLWHCQYAFGSTTSFINVFGFADGCTKLYEIPSENLVKEENCSFVNVLPANCNFNTEIWDITDPATPFIKLNFQKN